MSAPRHRPMQVDSKSTLFDAVWHLVQNILGVDDSTALRITRRRMTSQHDPTAVTKRLMELDDALHLLDRAEVDEVVKAQKKIKGKEPLLVGWLGERWVRFKGVASWACCCMPRCCV